MSLLLSDMMRLLWMFGWMAAPKGRWLRAFPIRAFEPDDPLRRHTRHACNRPGRPHLRAGRTCAGPSEEASGERYFVAKTSPAMSAAASSCNRRMACE